jgi:hypothetical protein
MRIFHRRQRLHELGARLLRSGASMQYQKKGSLAETFFPAALRSELPAIDGFKAACI